MTIKLNPHFRGLTDNQVYDLWEAYCDLRDTWREKGGREIAAQFVKMADEALDEYMLRQGITSPAPLREGVPDWIDKYLPRFLRGHQRGGGGG